MTQTRDLIKKMADFFTGEEFYEKGEDARLELSPNDVRCMNEVIKACGNAISRQAVLNALYALCDTGETLKENPWRDNPHIDAVIETIEELPPVTPQPKTGHWIDDNDEIDAQYGRHLYRCSECNEYADMFVGGTEDWWDLEKPNYCPNCGVKMG